MSSTHKAKDSDRTQQASMVLFLSVICKQKTLPFYKKKTLHRINNYDVIYFHVRLANAISGTSGKTGLDINIILFISTDPHKQNC